MFNSQVAKNDSLLKEYMLKNSRLMIERQQWRYDRALAWVNDTLQPQWPYLRDRFLYFNELWEKRAGHQAEELTARKGYFYDQVSLAPLRQAERRYYNAGGVDSRLYYPRFGFFNDKMERMDAALYRYYRNKSERAASDEGVKVLRALMAGRDTASLNRNRSLSTDKYTRRYEKVRDFLPMFHFHRPDTDTLPPLWLRTEGLDTVSTRRKTLAEFSEEGISAYYGLDNGKTGFTRSRLPLSPRPVRFGTDTRFRTRDFKGFGTQPVRFDGYDEALYGSLRAAAVALSTVPPDA